MTAPHIRKVQRYIQALESSGLTFAKLPELRARVAGQLQADRDFMQQEYLDILREICGGTPPDFALAFGASRHLAEMGIVGHAILSCGTLRRGLAIWMNYADLTGEPIQGRSDVSDGVWTLEFQMTAVLSPGTARFYSEEFAASFVRFARETTGYDCADAGVEFRHRKHDGIDYTKYLPERLSFGTPRNRLILPEAVLDMPILTRDDELFDLFVEQFVAHRSGQGRGGNTVLQLRQLIMTSPGETPKLDRAADALGLSPRTLNRRLETEGTCYSQVLAEFRNDYAKALVSDGTLYPSGGGHLLGFGVLCEDHGIIT